MSCIAIVQARMDSTRLPGKVMMSLCGRPALWHVVQRALSARGVDGVVVATTQSESDDVIRDFCAGEGIDVFSGSEDDVLDRYYRAAKEFTADPVVRVTADCPLLDPTVVERLILLYSSGGYDYARVAAGTAAQVAGVPGYPDGLDAECFSFAALELAWLEASSPDDREHVTPFLWRNRERLECGLLEAPTDLSGLRWTVDYAEDFELVSHVFEALLQEGLAFGYQDVLRFLSDNRELGMVNRAYVGREKYRHLLEALQGSDDTEETNE